MKHRKLFDAIAGTAIGGLLGTAVIACLVTAFDFSVSIWAVGFYCFAAALFSSLCFVRGWSFVPALLLCAVTVWLALDGVLMESVEGLVFRLTEVYNKGYGWPVLRWTDTPGDELAAEIPVILYLLGSLIVLCASWSVCRGQSVTPALLFSCVILGLCFVVTDKVPDTVWVFLTFFAGAMLLLPGMLRLHNEPEGRKLTAMVILPVFLSLLLLFAFVPKNGYNGDIRAKTWTKTVVETLRLEELWEKLTGEAFGSDVNAAGDVDLTQVGSRSYLNTEYLRVKADTDDVLYLRSRALDTYDGRSWTDSGENTALIWPDENHLESIGEVEISTRYAHRMLYLPYYTTSLSMENYSTGKENEHKLTRYSVTCARMPGAQTYLALYPRAGSATHQFAVQTGMLTQLPDSTQRWANQTVRELTKGMKSYYHMALAIERYVESAAPYNLKTERMPLGETDFARWFLEDAKSGYCVHYATAAAVLLRAAGIPARYVTGYMVRAKTGEEIVVKDSDAHAWVEYWLPGFGWTVLEATPAGESVSVTQPTQNSPVDTTLPTSHMGGVDPGKPQPQKQTFDGLWWVLACVGFAVLVIAQWRLRVRISRKRFGKGDTNRQILHRWVALEQVCRLLKQAPAEEMLVLAQKAKFSQYAITEEELALMDMALETAQKKLKKKNIFLQAYCTVILALY